MNLRKRQNSYSKLANNDCSKRIKANPRSMRKTSKRRRSQEESQALQRLLLSKLYRKTLKKRRYTIYSIEEERLACISGRLSSSICSKRLKTSSTGLLRAGIHSIHQEIVDELLTLIKQWSVNITMNFPFSKIIKTVQYVSSRLKLLYDPCSLSDFEQLNYCRMKPSFVIFEQLNPIFQWLNTYTDFASINSLPNPVNYNPKKPRIKL